MTNLSVDQLNTLADVRKQFPETYSIQTSSAGSELYVELRDSQGARFRTLWINDGGMIYNSNVVEPAKLL